MPPRKGAIYRKTHVSEHGRGFKYVRAIPVGLRPLFGGKTVWTQGLGQVSRPEAERMAREIAERHDAWITMLTGAEGPGDRALVLDAIELAETQRKANPSAALATPQKRETAQSVILRALQNQASVLQDVLAFQNAAAELLPVELDPALEHTPTLQTQAIVDAARWRTEQKTTVEKLSNNARIRRKFEGRPEERFHLSALITLWQKVKTPRSPKTVEKAALYVKTFVGVCGDLKPSEVTRTHAAKFADYLATQHLSIGTANLYMQKLHTLFNIALSENYPGVSANPFANVKARKVAKRAVDAEVDEGKKPFTPSQIKNLLTALHSAANGADDTNQHRKAAELELVTTILAYHGARSSEICQLTVDDVTSLYGVDVFRIHPRNGSVKTVTRDLPIHPACLAALKRQKALIEAADESRVAPDGSRWLFPETVCLRPGALRGHDYQLKAGRFLRDVVKIKDKGLTLHSLRHTFRDLCREAEMPEHISAAIMGHSLGRGDHGATYGKGVSLKSRAEWLAKIDLLHGEGQSEK